MTHRTYRTEFPSMANDSACLFATQAGWKDESWHNDACPRFVHEAKDRAVYIECLEPAQRESEGAARFLVLGSAQYDNQDVAVVYAGEDLEVMVEAMGGVAEQMAQTADASAPEAEGRPAVAAPAAGAAVSPFRDRETAMRFMKMNQDLQMATGMLWRLHQRLAQVDPHFECLRESADVLEALGTHQDAISRPPLPAPGTGVDPIAEEDAVQNEWNAKLAGRLRSAGKLMIGEPAAQTASDAFAAGQGAIEDEIEEAAIELSHEETQALLLAKGVQSVMGCSLTAAWALMGEAVKHGPFGKG